MTTQKLKTLLAQSGFTQEMQDSLMGVADMSSDRELTKDEIQRVIDLMSVEVAAAEVTAKALEDAASAFEDFIKDTESALEAAGVTVEK